MFTMPIDQTYRSTWTKSGDHKGHDVWTKKDGVIHGSKVGVDLNLCNGCMKCIGVCPTRVFEVYVFDGARVVDPVRESECILCMACELVCPTEALHVIRSGGSDDTLDSLLGNNL